MAFVRDVQSATQAATAGNFLLSKTTPAFASDPLNGETIVVFVQTHSGAGEVTAHSTPTDSAGNLYVQLGALNLPATGLAVRKLSMWYAANIVGAAGFTVTAPVTVTADTVNFPPNGFGGNTITLAAWSLGRVALAPYAGDVGTHVSAAGVTQDYTVTTAPAPSDYAVFLGGCSCQGGVSMSAGAGAATATNLQMGLTAGMVARAAPTPSGGLFTQIKYPTLTTAQTFHVTSNGGTDIYAAIGASFLSLQDEHGGNVGPGAYSVAGAAVELPYPLFLNLAPGAYAITGSAIWKETQMQCTLSPSPWLTGLDINGAPLAGGFVYVWVGGTIDEPVEVFTDSDGLVPHPQPIELDSSGRATIYLRPGSYRYDLYDADMVLVRTQDNIAAVSSWDVNLDIDGQSGENSDVIMLAGSLAYLSDGSGAKTAGRWYRTDADFDYASTLPIVGFVVSDLVGGASGPIRMMGRMTGMTGLVAGTTYYVGATAGALVSTAPTNARVVGVADSATSIVIDPDPPPAASTAQLTDVTGRNGEADTLAARETVFLSDGSGGKTAGSWYRAKADAAGTSTTPILGVVVSALATGASGAIRVIGRMTGFAGLTIGAKYYVDLTTAGTLTVTPPTLARLVGVADTATSMVLVPNPPPPVLTIGTVFGALDTSKVKNTSYLAATDLLVTFNGSDSNTYEGKTDAANPPTTIACYGQQGVTMVVKKGDYWKVNDPAGTGTSLTIRVVPVGT